MRVWQVSDASTIQVSLDLGKELGVVGKEGVNEGEVGPLKTAEWGWPFGGRGGRVSKSRC